MVYRKTWLAAGWLLVFLIAYISLIPSPPAPMRFPHADKLEHLISYAMLMGWFCQIYSARRQRIYLALACLAFGGIIELLQGWSGYRTADWLDWLADSLGVILGWALNTTSLQHLLTRLDARLASHHDR
ncbi:MAG: VanZ family protein [Nitrosomonadales bacterium]|nr:MAG: VanZ family protein [Nitrosomonadales bacterium]